MTKGKYVQIDAFYGGSTGSLMRRAHGRLAEEGWDSYIFWGRGKKSKSNHEVRFTRRSSVYIHVLLSRLFDRAGFYSKGDTKRLLRQLDGIEPDVVHLHGLQGYYINLPLIFKWLSEHDCEVKITLHDCWLMTGHCPHFTYYGCSRWKSGCHDCPLKKEYPASFFLDQSEKNYRDKKKLISLLKKEKTEILCPSEWMKSLVEQSFLGGFKCTVVNNQIDTSIFRKTKSDFREKHLLDGRYLILGVAAHWNVKKGLEDFFALWKMLDHEKFQILLIGLDRKQLKTIPSGISAIQRTDSQIELVEAYSAADIFFNPTYEDNYPTVNLEAEACELPVLTYDTGGCKETISRCDSELIEVGSLETVVSILNNRLSDREQNQRAANEWKNVD